MTEEQQEPTVDQIDPGETSCLEELGHTSISDFFAYFDRYSPADIFHLMTTFRENRSLCEKMSGFHRYGNEWEYADHAEASLEELESNPKTPESVLVRCRERISIMRSDFPNRDRNLKPKRKRGEGFVYLMIDDSGRTKIGISGNPHSRLRSMKTASPGIRMIGFWPGGGEDEDYLHKRYKDERIQGEWFNLKRDDWEKIAEYMESRRA